MLNAVLVCVIGTIFVLAGCTTTGNTPIENMESSQAPMLARPSSTAGNALSPTETTSPIQIPTPEIELNAVVPVTTSTPTPFEAGFGVSLEEALALQIEHDKEMEKKRQEHLKSLKDYNEPTNIPIIDQDPLFTLIPHGLPIDEGRTVVKGYGNSQHWAYYLELFTCNRSRNYSYGIGRGIDRQTNLTLYRLSDANRKSFCDTCVGCTSCSPTFLEGSKFYTVESLMEDFVTELEEKYPRRCRYER